MNFKYIFPFNSAYSKDTWDFLKELWNSPLGGKLGVSLVPCLQTSDTVSSIPSYSDFIYGFQVLKREELALYKKPQWKYVNIFTYVHRKSDV